MEESYMNIFISWSGSRSKLLAESLRDWLPKVIQKLNPWISASDIDKGSRWLKEISAKLESTSFGIICITPDNLNEPWILFEAGALSKAIDNSLVCPILFHLDPSSLKGPLSQFQATQVSKDDILKLLKTLNKNLKDDKLSEKQLEETFELWWPKLKSEIDNIPSADQKAVTMRSTEDILLEILRIVRALDRYSSKDSQIKEIIESILPTLNPEEERILRMRFGLGEHAPADKYKYFLDSLRKLPLHRQRTLSGSIREAVRKPPKVKRHKGT
jgi:hypothetical protein